MALSGLPPAKQWLRHLSFYMPHHPLAGHLAESLLKKVVQYEKKVGARVWLAQGFLEQVRNFLK